jgi:cell wall-associated NlpC family hydrolase
MGKGNKLIIILTLVLLSALSMVMVTNAEESAKGVTIAKDVNVRSGADTTATVIATLSLGEYVQIIDNEDDWYLIQLSNGNQGWVYNDLVVLMDETKNLIKKGIVTGDGVNVRDLPDSNASIIKTFSKGTEVKIVGESAGWYEMLVDDQLKGWIHSDYIQLAPNYATGRITASNVNMRKTPALDGEILVTLGMDNYVSIKTFNNGWYNVSTQNGKDGWIHQDYITVVLENGTDTAISRSASRTPAMSKIVDIAKQYLGIPYKYGTNGPSSFDCSGFTSYVFKSAGYSVARSSKDQAHNGEKVTKADLKTGDLVFFDTVGKVDGNITHVGIYIGDGSFIHASSGKNAKKVVISELNEGYYQDRFVTARRLI